MTDTKALTPEELAEITERHERLGCPTEAYNGSLRRLLIQAHQDRGSLIKENQRLSDELEAAEIENTKLHNRIDEIGSTISKYGDEALWDKMNDFDPDWSILESTRESLLEHMAIAGRAEATLKAIGDAINAFLVTRPSEVAMLVWQSNFESLLKNR